jgi:dienelactone hydrolase
MDQKIVSRRELDLKDDPGLLSPPWLAKVYACATSVTVYGFVPHASIEIEVAGATVVTQVVGFPQPVGATLALPAALVAGQAVRARQSFGGPQSDWSPAAAAIDHTVDFPAGPPRPEINPAPVFECGIRTGVGNLLAGAEVWITADGTEVGRVKGCNPQQGVSVSPPYGLNQHARAWSELCADPSPPSAESIAGPPPAPLTTPGFEPIYEGGEQLIVNNVVNGAAVTLMRNGSNVGTWGCWGGALQVGLSPRFATTDAFAATQSMCPGDPSSPTGSGTVIACSSLPAPSVGPIQGGDTAITVTNCALGATIKVWRNGIQVGTGAAPLVLLTQALSFGDTIVVAQELPGCIGQLALVVTVACVDAPTVGNPDGLDLFPVGNGTYSDGGAVKGTVYYPADDDGANQPFNARVAALGRVPLVVMVHGNHCPSSDPSHLGYDYFQIALAKMGIVAVSVDSNALNCDGGGVQNIEDRADLLIDSIRHFQTLDTTAGSIFKGRIDFGRVGLMGHSRGGDAVVTAASVIALPNVTIRGVLALAPTNFRFWNGLPTIVPRNYAFMTILPAGDGDVVDNNGAQFYDQAEPGPFRSQVYAHYTNHNFFNRVWTLDEGIGPPRVPRAEHERILTAYGCAFYRSVLLGHDTDRILAGYEKPAGVLTQNIYLSFSKAKQTTVDNHEDGNGIGQNSLGRPTTQSGGLSADEFVFARGQFGGAAAGAYNDSFFGLTEGMVARPGGPGRLFRSEIGKLDLRNREVWIRVAEVVAQQGSVPTGATGFRLGLEDGNGTTSFIDVNAVGGLPRPYSRPSETKSMLSTVRFSVGCFEIANPRLALDAVSAILIACDRKDERAVAFDDLEIVNP